jgi:uncharacterized protein YicC (UPF0701 family)
MLREELNITEGDILQSVLRIPNVIGQNEDMADEEEWKLVEKTVDLAITSIKKFRADEGLVLKADLIERIKAIEQNLKSIEPFEIARLDRIKDRLKKNMDEFVVKQQVDQNRYEQEILYYIEKLDIMKKK